MSGEGTPRGTGDGALPDGSDLAVALVVAGWHSEIAEGLLDGALRAAAEAHLPAPDVVRVPGAFELPLVCAELAAEHDAVVALGVIVRGGTPHFDHICAAATSGLTRVALDTATPIGFGVLTCDDVEQARDRAGLAGSREDKGREALLAAVEVALVLRDLRHRQARAGF